MGLIFGYMCLLLVCCRVFGCLMGFLGRDRKSSSLVSERLGSKVREICYVVVLRIRMARVLFGWCLCVTRVSKFGWGFWFRFVWGSLSLAGKGLWVLGFFWVRSRVEGVWGLRVFEGGFYKGSLKVAKAVGSQVGWTMVLRWFSLGLGVAVSGRCVG